MGRFEPVKINENVTLVDGSFVFTETTLMTYVNTHDHGSTTCSKIVSIGSGYFEENFSSMNYNDVLDWVSIIYGLFKRIEATSMDWFVRHLNNATLLYSFDVQIDSDKIDLANIDIKYLEEKGIDLLNNPYPHNDHGKGKKNSEVLEALTYELVDNWK